MLQQYLKNIQKELELTEEFIPDNGNFSIPLDQGLFVTIYPLQPQGFSLKCTLGTYPNDNEEFLNHMMLANLFGKGTNGSILGIDENEKNVVLTQHVEQDVEYKQFKDILEDFLNSIDVWRDEITRK